MKHHQESTAPKELLHDLQMLVAEAESMIGDTGTGHSDEAIASLRARFAAAQERFTDVCAGARQKVIAGARCTDGAIRANPYQSLAIAAGAGLLVGLLLGRRCK